MRKSIYLVKLTKDEYINDKIKYFKIPFTKHYITIGEPCIYSEYRFWNVYECGKKYGFINTVASWW